MTVDVKESTIEFKKLDPEVRKKLTHKVILRMYDGDELEDICKEIGLRNPALLMAAIIQDWPDNWRFIRAGIAMYRRMTVEKKMLEDCVSGNFKEKLDVDKQKTMLKATEWELERMSREVFEPPQKKSAAAPTIIMQFASLRGDTKNPPIPIDIPCETVDPVEVPAISRFERLLAPPKDEETAFSFEVIEEKDEPSKDDA